MCAEGVNKVISNQSGIQGHPGSWITPGDLYGAIFNCLLIYLHFKNNLHYSYLTFPQHRDEGIKPAFLFFYVNSSFNLKKKMLLHVSNSEYCYIQKNSGILVCILDSYRCAHVHVHINTNDRLCSLFHCDPLSHGRSTLLPWPEHCIMRRIKLWHIERSRR